MEINIKMVKRYTRNRIMVIVIILSFFLIPVDASDHVIIVEFYPNTYEDQDRDEYVSIYNPLNHSVDISGWRLSDKEEEIKFPPGTILGEKERLKIEKNASTIILANRGDEILLLNEDGELVDLVVYGEIDYDEGWIGSPIGKAYEGLVFERVTEEDTDTSEDWCSYLKGQSRFPVRSFGFNGEVCVFVSPDSSFHEITRVIDDAKHSLDICVYNFDNHHLMEHVLNATERGVDVRVLLEADPVGGIKDDTLFIAENIDRSGGKVRFGEGYAFFHAKYALIDGHTTLITTENWDYTGIPVDDTFGNRGWGIAINDENVTGYFNDVFEYDWGLAYHASTNASKIVQEGKCKFADVGRVPEGRSDVLSAHRPIDESDFAPQNRPTTPSGNRPSFASQNRHILGGRYDPSFKSMEISGNFTVTPVIAPDNALMRETIIGLIDSAEDSVYIEESYIHVRWGERPNLYLESAIDAARDGCEVRILLDDSWYDVISNLETVSYVNGIADEEGLDIEARLMDDTRLEKLHTKGLIVDGDKVLISSINWNEFSPTKNREVGVIISNIEVARYYTDVFLYDWGEKESLFPVVVLVVLIFIIGLFLIKRYIG
jgi:hypothetical protein